MAQVADHDHDHDDHDGNDHNDEVDDVDKNDDGNDEATVVRDMNILTISIMADI